MPFFQYWAERLKITPEFHRKQWEWVYITQVLWENGYLNPGSTGLVFGCGKEPLPALFASMGCKITATDLDMGNDEAKIWQNDNQHSGSDVSILNEKRICPDAMFTENVQYRDVDMNNIPGDLRNYDFCWSSCALEHIGGIEKSKEFLSNNLAVLRSGGLAVHTTEFNMSSNDNTLNEPHTCILREKDIQAAIENITKKGHYVYPFDLRFGTLLGDKYVDVPPYKLSLHLRLLLKRWTATSIGLIVRKK
jgi:SAM-dependent methyltransferase